MNSVLLELSKETTTMVWTIRGKTFYPINLFFAIYISFDTVSKDFVKPKYLILAYDYIFQLHRRTNNKNK